MDCREAGRALSAMVDGELAPSLIGSLEEHLGSCRSCAKSARVFEAVREHMAAMPRPDAPPDLSEKVLARIRRPGARLVTIMPLLRIAAAAAGILLVVSAAAAFLVGSDRSSSKPEYYTADSLLEMIALDHAPAFGAKETNR